VQDICRHIDFDGFAPEVAPDIADEPVPGRPFAHGRRTDRAGDGRARRIRAATLATSRPLDRADTTLRLALRLIELIGECAHRPQQRRPEKT
jgi:hypothetical protein